MPAFDDHFGGHAGDYAANRPTYPDALYAWIAEQAPATTAVWDCGTGNGQAALGLARHFDHVHATDASPGQIAEAPTHPNVTFAVASAEASGLPDASVDAITVAEAAHWFDLDAFYAEVRRVLRPGGLLAIWGYHRTRIDPAVDAVVERFRDDIEPFWPAGRERLDASYRTIPFPFDEITAPDLAMRLDWTVDAYVAYLHTWSAVKRCTAARGADPVTPFVPPLRDAWGPGVREVVWPLHWRVGFAR